jgi:hypothetical protein
MNPRFFALFLSRRPSLHIFQPRLELRSVNKKGTIALDAPMKHQIHCASVLQAFISCPTKRFLISTIEVTNHSIGRLGNYFRII